MYSVQTTIVQNKMHFAFNGVLDSEKCAISEMKCRATRDRKQHQKLCNAHYNEKNFNKLTRIKSYYIKPVHNTTSV